MATRLSPLYGADPPSAIVILHPVAVGLLFDPALPVPGTIIDGGTVWLLLDAPGLASVPILCDPLAWLVLIAAKRGVIIAAILGPCRETRKRDKEYGATYRSERPELFAKASVTVNTTVYNRDKVKLFSQNWSAARALPFLVLDSLEGHFVAGSYHPTGMAQIALYGPHADKRVFHAPMSWAL